MVADKSQQRANVIDSLLKYFPLSDEGGSYLKQMMNKI